MIPSLLDIEKALDARLEPLIGRLDRLLRRLEDVAEDVDELDRFNRPYGDGTKLPRERRRW
jgi:hypothetical protein